MNSIECMYVLLILGIRKKIQLYIKKKFSLKNYIMNILRFYIENRVLTKIYFSNIIF